LEDHDDLYYLGLLVKHLPYFITEEALFQNVWQETNNRNQDEEDKEDEDNSWGCRLIQGKPTEIYLKTKHHPKGSPAAMALIQYIKTQTGSNKVGMRNEAFWEYLYCCARQSAIQDI
jgi:hypothetical protein